MSERFFPTYDAGAVRKHYESLTPDERLDYLLRRDEVIITMFAAMKLQAKSHQEVVEANQIDAVTGILNRTGLIARHEEMKQHRRRSADRSHEKPDLIAVMDIDDFKMINDVFGHSEGNRALIKVATAVSDVVRKDDHVGRIGGDEFACILHGATPEEGAKVMRKAAELAKASLKHESLHVNPALSIGIAPIDYSINEFDEMADCADKAMYKAKREGGNRVQIF
jgi:diguanylate cyclase (GGDEF)-like protein